MQNRKFYVTPNRILDVDIVGDVRYLPLGSPTGYNISVGDGKFKPDLRKNSEFVLVFKEEDRDCIALYGEEADTAWKNYRRAADIGEGWELSDGGRDEPET